MKFLADVARSVGAAAHIYVVGGAVRNFVINQPIKDVDVMIDAVALKGRDSAWFARRLERRIPTRVHIVTNQYGVTILTVKGPWMLDGYNMAGEVIEIANARKESYGGVAGKGYKPAQVRFATVEEDTYRREFTFNTLMWRLYDLADGPDRAEIVDITGCGMADLQQGMIRCPSDPDKTFSDDPTRMLRAVKFSVKYGFSVDPVVRESILRNAHKIHNVPQNAVAKLLVDTLLTEQTGRQSVIAMHDLGLLDPLAEMMRSSKAFRSTMHNWAGRQNFVFLYELLEEGMPLDDPVSFLSASQRRRFQALVRRMHPDDAVILQQALAQPGIAWADKGFMPGLWQQFGIPNNQRGKLAQAASEITRDLLLTDPMLFDTPEVLRAMVLQRLRRQWDG
jgi:tRNA nucleotidyltransferase/poly(A) polymerase